MRLSRIEQRRAVWRLLCERAGISESARAAFSATIRLDSREREYAKEQEQEQEDAAPLAVGIRTDGQILHLQGPILPDDAIWILDCFGLPGICPTPFAEALGSMSGEIEFHVNSPGGDVAAMNVMLSALMEWRKKESGGSWTDGGNRITEARVTGIAASAAVSLLTTSRRCRVTAMPQAMLMVHEPAMNGMTAKDLRQFAAILEDDTETLADQYAAARGLDRESVLAEVREETWMSARRARTSGWFDEVYPVVEDAEDPEEEQETSGEEDPEEEPVMTSSGGGRIETDATATEPAAPADPAGTDAGKEDPGPGDHSSQAPAGNSAGEDDTGRKTRPSLLRRVRRRR